MTITPGFTGGWLDRADHVRADADALDRLMRDFRARVLRLDDVARTVGPDGRLGWSSLAEVHAEAELLFLGMADELPHFVELLPGAAAPARSAGLNRALMMMRAEEAAIFGTARQLVDWHRRHQFCANCGNPTAPVRGGWVRRCDACETEHFPRVDPVVIMLAEHDGRALVGRGASFPPGRFSALAGFIEPGESIEEAVQREVFEEAGVRVRDVRYVASQPWPFPGQLMIGCVATADDPTLNLDPKEIAEALWVTRDEVRAVLAEAPDAPFGGPPHYAIAHTLMAHWAG